MCAKFICYYTQDKDYKRTVVKPSDRSVNAKNVVYSGFRSIHTSLSHSYVDMSTFFYGSGSQTAVRVPMLELGLFHVLHGHFHI